MNKPRTKRAKEVNGMDLAGREVADLFNVLRNIEALQAERDRLITEILTKRGVNGETHQINLQTAQVVKLPQKKAVKDAS